MTLDEVANKPEMVAEIIKNSFLKNLQYNGFSSLLIVGAVFTSEMDRTIFNGASKSESKEQRESVSDISFVALGF